MMKKPLIVRRPFDVTVKHELGVTANEAVDTVCGTAIFLGSAAVGTVLITTVFNGLKDMAVTGMTCKNRKTVAKLNAQIESILYEDEDEE